MSRAALIGRIQEELKDLELVVNRAERLMDKARKTGDDDYLGSVALDLHGFYSGAERILQMIATEIDGAVPKGAEWHRELLIQMSAEVPGVRPAIITRNTRYCLDDYRGFRHIVRNVYAFNLRPSRLQELVAGVRGCYDSLQRDLVDFTDFLIQLAQTTR